MCERSDVRRTENKGTNASSAAKATATLSPSKAFFSCIPSEVSMVMLLIWKLKFFYISMNNIIKLLQKEHGCLGTISGVIFSCSNAIKSIYLNGIYLSSKGDEIYGKQMPELRRYTSV